LVNECLEDVQVELPTLEQVFAEMDGARIVGVMDIKSAFLHQELDEQSRDLVSFPVPGRGTWRATRLVFGLKTATQSWVQALQEVLHPWIGKGVQIFVDDIVLHARDEQQYLRLLAEVLDALQRANIVLNLKKCRHGLPEVEILGHRYVVDEGIYPSQESIRKLLTVQRPRNMSQLRSLLGVANWLLRRRVPHYSEVVAGLTDCLLGIRRRSLNRTVPWVKRCWRGVGGWVGG
jgi:hypothetical protein